MKRLTIAAMLAALAPAAQAERMALTCGLHSIELDYTGPQLNSIYADGVKYAGMPRTYRSGEGRDQEIEFSAFGKNGPALVVIFPQREEIGATVQAANENWTEQCTVKPSI